MAEREANQACKCGEESCGQEYGCATLVRALVSFYPVPSDETLAFASFSLSCNGRPESVDSARSSDASEHCPRPPLPGACAAGAPARKVRAELARQANEGAPYVMPEMLEPRFAHSCHNGTEDGQTPCSTASEIRAQRGTAEQNSLYKALGVRQCQVVSHLNTRQPMT